MQVSKINSANFKGLWEIKTIHQKKLSDDLGDGFNISYQDAIYHPFKDETPEEIAKEMKKEQVGEVWENVDSDGDKYYPYSVEVTEKVTRGETLGVTKAEFEAMQIMAKSYQGNSERHYPVQGWGDGWEKSKYTPEEYIEQIGGVPGREIVDVK